MQKQAQALYTDLKVQTAQIATLRETYQALPMHSAERKVAFNKFMRACAKFDRTEDKLASLDQ